MQNNIISFKLQMRAEKKDEKKDNYTSTAKLIYRQCALMRKIGSFIYTQQKKAYEYPKSVFSNRRYPFLFVFFLVAYFSTFLTEIFHKFFQFIQIVVIDGRLATSQRA